MSQIIRILTVVLEKPVWRFSLDLLIRHISHLLIYWFSPLIFSINSRHHCSKRIIRYYINNEGTSFNLLMASDKSLSIFKIRSSFNSSNNLNSSDWQILRIASFISDISSSFRRDGLFGLFSIKNLKKLIEIGWFSLEIVNFFLRFFLN